MKDTYKITLIHRFLDQDLYQAAGRDLPFHLLLPGTVNPLELLLNRIQSILGQVAEVDRGADDVVLVAVAVAPLGLTFLI